MNILHISPYYPSLEANHAGGVCMGKQIETLRQWHTVYVLTFEASEFDGKLAAAHAGDDQYQSVRIGRWNRMVHVALEPWMPMYFAARSSLRFACCLVQTIRKRNIDAIHMEYASMGQYLWIKQLYPHLKIYLVEHDMTAQSYMRKVEASSGLKRLFMSWQMKLVLRQEGKYCHLADGVFTMNQKDRDLIEKYYGRRDSRVLNPYYGLEDEVLDRPVDLQKRQKGNICFLGQMGRDENYLAAMRLIRLSESIKKDIPELQVYIVGNQPPEALKQRENDYIHVTGFVDDVDVYLEQAELAVFPLELGAGIKLKVLRSLALGTPVVTSMVGAEGIDETGEVICLAETDEEFVDSTVRLLKSGAALEERRSASRRFVKEHFGWHVSEKILREVYDDRDGK